MKIEGLNLWEARLQSYTVRLFITTSKRNAGVAYKKAIRFLSRHKKQYPGAGVICVNHLGTLDA